MAGVARPQYTMQQRNFLAHEYHKRKGSNNFKHQFIADCMVKFPGAGISNKNTIGKIWTNQLEKGTVNNCNRKSSHGDSFSGRPRTARTPANTVLVKGVMDRDAVKVILIRINRRPRKSNLNVLLSGNG